MMISNHTAVISYDEELQLFRGEFIGLNGHADFYADSVSALYQEGEKSLEVFLQVCQEQGIDPYLSYSGKLMTRLPTELHRKIADTAKAKGVSLNQWITDTLSQAVQTL